MSELRSKSGDAALIIAPASLSERGSPNWLQVRVGLRDRRGRTDEAVALTSDDLAELVRGLRAIGGGADRFEMNGQDETFQIRIEPAASVGDVQVGVWLGEPYDVMRGFRIVAGRADVDGFAATLEQEAAAVDATPGPGGSRIW